jgi:hypothetical protein
MRKRRYGSLIWGGLLVVLGLVLLVDNLDLLGDWNAPIRSLLLGAFSLVFLATYIRDREQWWALIPGLVILGIAVAVFLAEQDLVEGYVVATIILAGVGLPFLLIYLSDRQHWWALIPAMTMVGIAAGVFLEGLGAIGGPAVGGLAVGGISLGFVSIYLIDREQWWALIPGGVMGVLAFFLLLAAAAKFIWPAALIALGLLLLRSSLRRDRRRARRTLIPSAPMPSIDTAELDRAIKATEPQRERLPSLEEQIAAAIREEHTTPPPEEAADQTSETEEPGSPADMPPTPEIPEPPEVPSGPLIE